jgi:hypothetical protein
MSLLVPELALSTQIGANLGGLPFAGKPAAKKGKEPVSPGYCRGDLKSVDTGEDRGLPRHDVCNKLDRLSDHLWSVSADSDSDVAATTASLAALFSDEKSDPFSKSSRTTF